MTAKYLEVYGTCYYDDKHHLILGLYPAILPNSDAPIWYVGYHYTGSKYCSYGCFQPSNIEDPEKAQAELDKYAKEMGWKEVSAE